MATLSIGPGLAGFPAFPDPAAVNPFALGFAPTADSLSFGLNGYRFTFTGDFAAAEAAFATPGPFGFPLFFLALSPLFDPPLPIRLDSAAVVREADAAPVIGFSGASAALGLGSFFATLLDPANYTDDILTAFFGSTAPFDTLDLSAIGTGVVMARPNAAVTGPGGERGVIAFAQELDRFAFTTVIGGSGDDRLGGTAADETLLGQGGNDVLLGGAGDDTLEGGAGNDVLEGGAGDDVLGGGDGQDVLVGGAGSNRLAGGRGDDTFVIHASAGRDTIEGFRGAEGDRLDLSALGLSAPDLAAALAAGVEEAGGVLVSLPTEAGVRELLFLGGLPALSDIRLAPGLTGGFGQVFAAPDGAAELVGSRARDTLVGSDSGMRLRADTGNDVVLGGADDDSIEGGVGRDTLSGGAGRDAISGGQDADVLFGGAGDDRLFGDAGADFLDGGDGDDLLSGGSGANTLTGGAGADVFVFANLDGLTDRVTDFEVGLDRIDIRSLLGRAFTPDQLADYVRVTSPGPTELTRFLSVDRDGAGGLFAPVEIAQFDDLDDAALLDPGNYLF